MHYERFKAASDALACEIDLEVYLYNARILKMIMRALTKKRQRKAVQYFERYMANNKHVKGEEELGVDDMTAE